MTTADRFCERTIAPPLFESYLREIGETPLLSPGEERDLARRISEGDAAARGQMVRANLRLVVRIARAYAGRGLPLDDLVAEGNLGLFPAAERFDPSRGVRFGTYADHWIKRAIKAAIIDTGTVRIPVNMAALVSRWRRAAARLREELGRPPAQGEVAGRLGLSARKARLVRKAVRLTARPWPLSPAGPAARGEGPGAELERREEVAHVLRLLGEMDAREAAVLRLRFGVGGGGPGTLREVGDRLGLSHERVRQVEHEGLRKLRERLGAA